MLKSPTGKRLLGGWLRVLMRHSLRSCLLGIAVFGAVGMPQSAAATEPYGEVTRFGGPVKEFEASALSPQDEGKLVLPVGFAVEPENGTTHEKNVVYVLDRIFSSKSTGVLDYRLQELSSVNHDVLASSTIVEQYTDKSHYSDVHPLVGLAVSDKRVYTIVESMLNTEGTTYVPVVSKLVAWSTEPNSKKEFTRAEPTEFTEPDGVTGASVVANEAAFKVAGGLSEVLYEPAGLAVDNVNGNVAIEAQAGVTAPRTAGPTTVQIVYTNGIDKGQLGAKWTDGNAIGALGEWQGNGLFAGAAENEFGVDQFTQPEQPAALSTVSVISGTATPIAQATPGDGDEIASIVNEAPLSGYRLFSELAFNEVHAAGTSVVQLPGKVYAGIFAQPSAGEQKQDFQAAVAPWEFEESGTSVSPQAFWIQGNSSGATAGLGNLGIRLFEADGKVLDTIGGGAPNSGTPSGVSELGSCNIDFRRASLAVGAEGAIFVLTQPRAEGKTSAYEYDDEIIEFAPGGQYKCPGLREGSVESRQHSDEQWKALQKGSEPEPNVSVAEGVPISFSAQSLDQAQRNLAWKFTTYEFKWPLVYEWTPFAFEWNLEGASSGGPGNDGYTVVNKIEAGDGFLWPSPEVNNFTYPKGGIYHASVRVYGAYGTKVYPFVVHVLGSTPPKAEFPVPSSITAGVPVVFDGEAESVPTSGTEVEYYEWSFGGEHEPPTTTTEGQIPHTFVNAGKYMVTLVIHDKAGAVRESKAAEHEVTVAAQATTTTTTSSSASSSSTSSTSSSTTKSSTTSTSTTTTKTTTSSSSTKKAPTKKELLARALKACHKDKSKKKRTNCEHQAQKKYGTKPKPKKKPGKK